MSTARCRQPQLLCTDSPKHSFIGRCQSRIGAWWHASATRRLVCSPRPSHRALTRQQLSMFLRAPRMSYTYVCRPSLRSKQVKFLLAPRLAPPACIGLPFVRLFPAVTAGRVHARACATKVNKSVSSTSIGAIGRTNTGMYNNGGRMLTAWSNR